MNSGQLLDYNRQSAITGGTYNGRYGDETLILSVIKAFMAESQQYVIYG